MRKNSSAGKKGGGGKGGKSSTKSTPSKATPKSATVAATATPVTVAESNDRVHVAEEEESMEWEDDRRFQDAKRIRGSIEDLELASDEDDDEDDDEEEQQRRQSKGSSNPVSNLPPSPFSLPPRMRIDQLALEGQGSEDDDDCDTLEKKREQKLKHTSSSPASSSAHAQVNKSGGKQNTIAKKQKKPGIIYLSSIPAGYNVSMTTQFFSQFGQVGRVFLQPDVREKAKSKDNYARNFTEGWIEFLSKRLAKDVAGSLNNTAVGGKKRSKAHGTLWNIKYLPRFKWVHLSERLAYETAVHHQKMRTEISKAKREADHFKSNVEKSKRQEKASRKRAATSPAAAAASTATVASGSPASPGGTAPEGKRFKLYEFRQKETDETIKKRKSAAENAVAGEGSSSGRVSSPPAAAGKSKGKKKNKSKGKTAQAKSSSSVASADRSAFLQSVFSSKE